jgi:hypothetical protein
MDGFLARRNFFHEDDLLLALGIDVHELHDHRNIRNGLSFYVGNYDLDRFLNKGMRFS